MFKLKITSSMWLSLLIKNFEDPDKFKLLNEIEWKSKIYLKKSKLNYQSNHQIQKTEKLIEIHKRIKLNLI